MTIMYVLYYILGKIALSKSGHTSFLLCMSIYNRLHTEFPR